MSDITKCHGVSCPISSKCFRYTARPVDQQAYADFDLARDGDCEHYMRNYYSANAVWWTDNPPGWTDNPSEWTDNPSEDT